MKLGAGAVVDSLSIKVLSPGDAPGAVVEHIPPLGLSLLKRELSLHPTLPPAAIPHLWAGASLPPESSHTARDQVAHAAGAPSSEHMAQRHLHFQSIECYLYIDHVLCTCG